MSGSNQCPHTDVHADFKIASSGDTNIRYLEVSGHCRICDAPIQFRGVPIGLSPDRPAGSPLADIVRLPMMFVGETYDGKALGFIARPKLG